MKKIFTLVCAAIVALGLNAAPRQFNGQIGANGKPVFKHFLQHVDAHHHARKAANALLENENFSFQISDITAMSADVAITPVDKTAAYMYGYVDAASYAAASEAELANEMKSQLDYMIMIYSIFGEEITYADLASVGDDAVSLTDLEPNTEYVVFVYLLDLESGLALSAFDTAHFTTQSMEMSDNIISMSYANDSLYISTTNDDPYFFIFESKADYEYYQPDYSEASIKAEIKDWISSADEYGMLGYLVFYGDTAINVNDFSLFIFGEDLESDDYIALAAPFSIAINGAPKYHEFHFDAAPIVCTDTVDIHIIEPEWLDAVAEQGWWQVTGAESTDTAYYVTLSNNYVEAVPGIYDKADMDLEFTYLFDATVGIIDFHSLTVEIVEQDGYYIIKADFVGKDAIYYRLTFDAIPVGGTGLEEIAAQIQSMGNKFLHHGQVMIHNNGHFYHMLGGQLK